LIGAINNYRAAHATKRCLLGELSEKEVEWERECRAADSALDAALVDANRLLGA
jgi:hypothetical protein